MKNPKIKIGLFGAGYFGKLHLKNLLNTPFDVVGFYDPEQSNTSSLEKDFGVRGYSNPDELMELIDAVDIVTPTTHHIALALKALEQNKHIFIEKPIASNANEAEAFIKSMKDNGKDLSVQVGHIERFNPAFKEAVQYCIDPVFIRARRLAQYNPRANDVSVIHDLMIHDIDALLSLVKSPVKEIRASGACPITKHTDWCEARIEFENGCIANLEASRMYHDQTRMMEILCDDSFITVDFLKKEFHLVNRQKIKKEGALNHIAEWMTPKGDFHIKSKMENFPPSNAILEELVEFYNSIANNEPVRVSHNDAFQALFIADKIQEIALRSDRV